MFEKILSEDAKKSLALLERIKIIKEAYLAGGTAMALQLGHRESKDLDFFSKKRFSEKKILKQLQKSFEILQHLRKKYDFVLIGGWAVFLYTKSLKSKDIDMVVEYSELEKLAQEFRVIKNSRLKKYEIKIEEIDVDIYLPHFSNLGFPAEAIFQYAQNIEGFKAPRPETLLILKQHVYGQRKNSPKGEKDKLDIFCLLKSQELDWQFYKKLLKEYKKEDLLNQLKNLLENTHELREINLNRYQIAKLKRKILACLEIKK